MRPADAAALLNSASFARSPRFPAVGFTSYGEFKSYLAANQTGLDARYEYEPSLPTREAKIVKPGTCAPRLRPANFVSETQSGEMLPDGRRLPNWREEMRCDCGDRLISRQRALVHFLQASGLLPWMHLVLFGTPGDADRRLASMVAKSTAVSRPHPPAKAKPDVPLPQLRMDCSVAQFAVSQDYLQFAPPIGAALSEICDTLIAGGRFIFTVPFHFNEPSTSLMPKEALAFAREQPWSSAAYRTNSVGICLIF